MKRSLWFALSALVFSTLACEPVIAIGWKEIFFVFALVLFMFGPPVYRFIRRLETQQKRKREDK